MNALAIKAMNISMLASATQAGDSEVVAFNMDLLIRLGIHIVMVVGLFVIIAAVLLKPVRKMLEERKNGIQQDFDDIASGKEEVKDLKAKYEGKLANIKSEADQILSDAHKKSLEQQKEIINEAKEEAERIITRAKLEVKREEEKARDELKQEVIAVASLMAGKFIASSMDPVAQGQLLDESIDEIGDSLWKK